MNTKVLSFVPTKDLNGGGEKSFFEVLKFTQQHGYENHVIVPEDSSSGFLQAMKDSNIKYTLGSFSAFSLHGDRTLPELKEVFDIAKIIQDTKPDIFMTNLYIEPSQWAAALLDVPHIYFDRGHLGLLNNRGQLPNEPPAFIKYANAIICNSKNGQDILKDKYYTEGSLVYSFVDRPKVKLKNDSKARIIMPSNFFREKNHLDVLAAIAKLKVRDSKFDTQVVFMGSKINDSNNEYYNQILDYVKEHDLDNLVQIVEHKSNPWEYFSQRDIYVNPGEGEAVGRATAEAEMLGITALISDIPGHWEHKALLGNRYTFKLHDVDDLADHISELLDQSNWKKIQEHNQRVQENIIQWMTPEKTMGEILNVIENIKNQNNPARELVYNDILNIINYADTDYNRLKVFEATIATNVAGIISEIELLRKPGVRLATRKLGGAVRRKLWKCINNKMAR